MAKRPPRGTSALLINEPPLQVLPSLALVVGLNEAIIVQQMHFWLLRSTHVIDGTPWVYNTYEEWQKQFPFWSIDTIKRAIYRLEALGVVASTASFNRNPIDKSKWYALNHTRLNELCHPTTMQDATSTMQNATSTMQDAPMDDAECHEGVAECHASQRDPSEISTEIPLSQTPPPAGEGLSEVAVAGGEEESADAPEPDRWTTCPAGFFAEVAAVIDHPPARSREPPRPEEEAP